MAAEVKNIFRNEREGRKLVDSTTKFTLDLYTDLASSGSGNVFLSPISISMALAMTYIGARGNTLAQMKTGMHFGDVDEAELHQAFSDIREALHGSDGKYTLHTANRLFGENTYRFLDDFLAATKKFYGAELAAVDFAKNLVATVKLINGWVAGQTNQKIQDIVPLDAVDGNTVLILINAIYFKGDWENQFNSAQTREGDFHVSPTERVKVPMMFMMEAEVMYGVNKDLQCQAIELPYLGKTMSMVIILPESGASLKTLEAKLTANVLNQVNREFSMHMEEVNIWIPRFKLQESLELTSALAKLGIVDLFAKGIADLSGMAGTNNLYVSYVFHKAFIEVNEKGSEAAAATAVIIQKECCMIKLKEPTVFKAEHPFLFYIRHNVTNAILFIGRLVKP